MIVAAEVVPRVIQKLADGMGRKTVVINSSEIKEAVWDVLRDMLNDTNRRKDYEGIIEAWDTYKKGERIPPPDDTDSGDDFKPRVYAEALKIPIVSNKSHGTIWGKQVKRVKDIPQSARPGFKAICCVSGIASLKFGKFKQAHYSGRCYFELRPSKNKGIIEGKCFDNGKKGQLQTFQIRIHDSEHTEVIRLACFNELRERGFVRSRN